MGLADVAQLHIWEVPMNYAHGAEMVTLTKSIMMKNINIDYTISYGDLDR